MKFGEKIAGMLSKPSETFKKLDREDFKDSLVYFGILSAVVAVLSGLPIYFGVHTLFPEFFSENPALTIVKAYIGAWISLFIGGAWLHLWLLVMGYRGKITDTYKAIIYGDTPSYLFGWIPFVNLIVGIWSAILVIFGTSEYGKIEWWRSLVAMIIAVLIIAVAAVAISGLTLIGTFL